MSRLNTPALSPDPLVFGLLSDEGWILERLASAIAAEYPGFSYGTRITGQPDVVYYLTFAARKAEFDGPEIAYFAHIEEGFPAETQFFETAAKMDFCVTQAPRYEQALCAAGTRNVQTIPPGIDHQLLRPRLQVGIVGRTYHTGRKGEAMMARLMDMPDVEFHFTGDGWPGPPRHVPEGRMQDFYRAMDYILVPSLYEGGPMCVPEALACGIPVIAPDVGWVNSFPHIPYPKGDTDALRSLLQNLARPKLDLAKAAAGHTWQQWGQAHAALFRKVWSGHCRTSPVRPKTALSRASVVQVLHGGEAISQGGPSVRVPQTARRLAAVCRQSDLQSGTGQIRSADIGHFYNIWQPDTALTTAMALKRRVRRLVFSPILLNLSQRAFWEDDMTRILAATPAGPMRLRAALPQLQRRYAATLADEALALRGAQPVPGFAAKLRACIALADQTVFLSGAEKALAQGLTGTDTAHFPVLPNPVDTGFFTPGPGAGSALAIRLDKEFGLPPGHPFLLAVGRVEPRKNQLMMAEAARRTGVPLIIAGHTGSQAYADLVAEAGGGTTSLIGRVAPGSRDLLWLYQNCAAFLSFSWAEGASLATLEAAACGAPLVLTDLSGEQGYFGEMARYTGPLATDDAVAAIRAAIGAPADRQKQHRYIAARYGWDAHLAGLSAIYEALL